MKKAVVITGIAFLIGVILIASANYVIISREKRERSETYKMRIDAVTNRHHDARWIINKSVEEALEEEYENCTKAAEMVEENLESALQNNNMNEGPVNFYTDEDDIRTLHEEYCPDKFILEVEYTVESEDESVRKKEYFLRNYTHP